MRFGVELNKCPDYLYIHWPFCKNKCHYCDFVALEKHEKFMKQYHEALCNEIKAYAKTIGHPIKIKTIFFGGGTPSLYPLGMLEELFKLLNSLFDLSEAKEISLEVNPGGITDKHLSTWKNLGINRLSIGMQVLDDKVLSNLNRMQTNEDVYDLIKKTPKYFDNYSADLILGLPGVTEEIWQNTLDQVVKWPITHVSIYMLMVHRKTPLYFRIKKGELKISDDDVFVSTYEKAVKFLEKHGFKQYETSNFTKPGFESMHNQAYWDHKPYRGFGVGAASFDGTKRFTNIKNLTDYISTYSASDALVHLDSEELSDQQLVMERLMLGLRQRKGMDLHSMVYLFKESDRRGVLRQLDILKEQGLISLHDDHISLTLRGMALENEVVLSLL